MVMTIIIPTRNRPDSTKELIEVLSNKISDIETRVAFAVDYDDPRIDDYMRIDLAPNMRMYYDERLRMNGTLNRLAVKLSQGRELYHDVIGFMGDDHRPRTYGFDAILNQALAMKPGVAYGNDLYRGRELCTSAFINSWIVSRLGYFSPPKLIHLYMDNFWMELGKLTNLTYLQNVHIEHMHPSAGKGAWDEGYMEANSSEVDQHDRAEFLRYMREDWPKERLRV